MALDQNRYIKIDSAVNSGDLAERDFSGLVFCADEMLTTASNKANYDNKNVITLTRDGVAKSFAADSDIAKFADRYFAYSSPAGGTPTHINVRKMDDDTPVDAISDVNSDTSNFGAFTFLGDFDDTYELSALKAAAEKNASFNVRYLMVVCSSADDIATIYGANGLSGIAGLHVVQGYDKYDAALALAVAPCIDFNGTNTTVDLMFKTLSGMTPSVHDESSADTLDLHNINYYGRVQVNGQVRDFYQRGNNMDGFPTGCYINEMWLKSSIATDYFNYVSSVGKIPASYDGAASIRALVVASATQGLKNGTIEVGKILSDEDRRTVFTLTEDTDAADLIESSGYWLDVVIVKDGNEYKAVYRLVYAKGDAIRFVQGYHNLI